MLVLPERGTKWRVVSGWQMGMTHVYVFFAYQCIIKMNLKILPDSFLMKKQSSKNDSNAFMVLPSAAVLNCWAVALSWPQHLQELDIMSICFSMQYWICLLWKAGSGVVVKHCLCWCWYIKVQKFGSEEELFSRREDEEAADKLSIPGSFYLNMSNCQPESGGFSALSKVMVEKKNSKYYFFPPSPFNTQ